MTAETGTTLLMLTLGGLLVLGLLAGWLLWRWARR
jgi:LPXTG-motif cell wall-anchored protein